jgi:hypothetical protein
VLKTENFADISGLTQPMPDHNLVKILFHFYSDVLDSETVETMWAEVVDKEYGYYKIANIPFYMSKIASDDVVWARFNEDEGMLTYCKTVQPSGNSTVHIIIMQEGQEIEPIRNIFKDMGCVSEKLNNKYFALEVPAAVDYLPVLQKLDELTEAGVIDYAESCLSQHHGGN